MLRLLFNMVCPSPRDSIEVGGTGLTGSQGSTGLPGAFGLIGATGEAEDPFNWGQWTILSNWGSGGFNPNGSLYPSIKGSYI